MNVLDLFLRVVPCWMLFLNFRQRELQGTDHELKSPHLIGDL